MDAKQILEAVERARGALGYFDGRIFDGHGKFANLSAARYALAAAAEEIEKARAAIEVDQ
ncbi:MAG: hypothetical protein HQL40_03285 [Alphaproteobacteria bacterium]|nr:hypothetical protein [Alphaproteobacteria bacterium]MBF0372147.1 hypothetical protein [Alphaproteobacteria bacterium]